MSSYVFRIHEVREHQNVVPVSDSNGHWKPSYIPGYNVIASEGASGTWWLCAGGGIGPLNENALPSGLRLYRTSSVFFCDGRGFWVLAGNAINPIPGDDWRPLCFEHDTTDNSSFLTNAKEQPALYCRRADQVWVTMLLPDVYHGSLVVQQPGCGGLKGELPIFLALIALAIPVDQVQQYLPSMFHGGAWQQYNMAHGRVHKRGVIVEVYTYSRQAGGSEAKTLEDLEEGRSGKYYA